MSGAQILPGEGGFGGVHEKTVDDLLWRAQAPEFLRSRLALTTLVQLCSKGTNPTGTQMPQQQALPTQFLVVFPSLIGKTHAQAQNSKMASIMFPQLLAAMPELLEGLLLASVVGAACYLFVFCLKQPKIIFTLAGLSFLGLLILSHQTLVVSAAIDTICAALLAPLLASFAQKHLVTDGQNWLAGYAFLFLSTVLSVFGVYLLYFYARPALISISEVAGMTMFITAVAAPSFIAFFLWILQNSQPRPGIDKHLEI